MKKLALATLALFLLAIAVLGSFLLHAHWQVRTIDMALPSREALASLVDIADAPIDIRYLNTGKQENPAGTPMAYPVFVLEWADGRRFAIDAGMDAKRARDFGKPIEFALGFDPMEPLGSVGRQLGTALGSVAGIAFTHLHVDHTQGIASLCPPGARPLRVFQTPTQADVGNYMTNPGKAQLEDAACARIERLAGGPLFEIPGFPGLVAIEAGGHTPGSTVFATHVQGTTWLFSGDITNFRDAMLEDRPKERIYSLFITPEAPARLSKLRRWLAALDADPRIDVVVSHDGTALESSGLRAWEPPAGDTRAR
ncbi:MAG: MBL fold metallo-hydrolase [Myxococcales bacterium]|nr:MBL fold metallo-hydrolase [Myxococcales bacterium]